jgi:phosphinothricin acetyltransferase
VSTPIAIRSATEADAGAIGAIYDEGIATGNATFAEGPHPAEERRAWLRARDPRAPVFVGVATDQVVAWSALAPFSGREWYSGVAEYTVYVSGAARGRGLGARMLDHLVSAAPDYGYWKLVGMILPENAAGLALAQKRGFRRVGTYTAHGRIAGQWRDVVLLERHLDR